MKSIAVKPETYKHLALLKIELGLSSFNEVINYLLNQKQIPESS